MIAGLKTADFHAIIPGRELSSLTAGLGRTEVECAAGGGGR
jgi:hypothetical protein